MRPFAIPPRLIPKLALLTGCLLVASSQTLRAEDVEFTQADGSKWTIKITPGPVAAVSVPEGKAGQYEAVYRAIPFSRVEFEANPSYRHDATMEILMDQLRPVNRTSVQQNVRVDAPRGFDDPILRFYPGYWRSPTIRQVP